MMTLNIATSSLHSHRHAHRFNITTIDQDASVMTAASTSSQTMLVELLFMPQLSFLTIYESAWFRARQCLSYQCPIVTQCSHSHTIELITRPCSINLGSYDIISLSTHASSLSTSTSFVLPLCIVALQVMVIATYYITSLTHNLTTINLSPLHLHHQQPCP